MQYTKKIITVADVYAKTCCILTVSFLELIEFDPQSVSARQKSFGWLLYLMFHIEQIETSEVSLIISSIQTNMFENGSSASEINNFFDLSDKYYRLIVAEMNAHGDIIKAIQSLFGEFHKEDALYNMECSIKIAEAIRFSIDSFHGFCKKIQSEMIH